MDVVLVGWDGTWNTCQPWSDPHGKRNRGKDNEKTGEKRGTNHDETDATTCVDASIQPREIPIHGQDREETQMGSCVGGIVPPTRKGTSKGNAKTRPIRPPT